VAEGNTITLSRMEIYGTLKVQGTAPKQVIFRNYRLATESEEANDSPGKWAGLNFHSGSLGSVIENAEIFYGGQFQGWYNDFGAAIKVDNCDITIKDSYLHENLNKGIMLLNSNSLIDNVRFFDHTYRGYAIERTMAVYLEGASPTIKNCYFERQQYGIYMWKYGDIMPTPILESNTFVDTIAGGESIYGL
jgi:hypothetical protein